MPCLSVQFDPAVGPIVNLGVGKPNTMTPGAAAQDAARAYVALIDTGASITCLSPKVAEEVGLQPIGKRPTASAHGVQEVNLFLADIALPFGDPTKGALAMAAQSMQVMEFQPGPAVYQALLGRDIIYGGLFAMTGYDKRFTICM